MSLLDASRGLHIYLKTLEIALLDDRISFDEATMLRILGTSLGVSAMDLPDCVAIARGEMPSPISEIQVEEWSQRETGDVVIYQAVLVAALDDDEITSDEMAMLNALGEVINLQDDEHGLIEEAIRSTAPEDEMGRRRLDRLDTFISRSPWS
ncbi:MAG: hypothetical protein QGH90_08060 [Candidatus Poseidoniaceae archaeon]|jgi:hypothetical protein|nr:hypothetical protein [Candidatus Poseidoniaceae archaeon]MDP7001840.1 hypothetical protein [Candidatus Poseidoniaceae archaeon]